MDVTSRSKSSAVQPAAADPDAGPTEVFAVLRRTSCAPSNDRAYPEALREIHGALLSLGWQDDPEVRPLLREIDITDRVLRKALSALRDAEGLAKRIAVDQSRHAKFSDENLEGADWQFAVTMRGPNGELAELSGSSEAGVSNAGVRIEQNAADWADIRTFFEGDALLSDWPTICVTRDHLGEVVLRASEQSEPGRDGFGAALSAKYRAPARVQTAARFGRAAPAVVLRRYWHCRSL